jgi:hypothetical protein
MRCGEMLSLNIVVVFLNLLGKKIVCHLLIASTSYPHEALTSIIQYTHNPDTPVYRVQVVQPAAASAQTPETNNTSQLGNAERVLTPGNAVIDLGSTAGGDLSGGAPSNVAVLAVPDWLAGVAAAVAPSQFSGDR